MQRTIEECLVSIKKNRVAELIVIDGNSTDKTVEIARRFTSAVYSDEGRGPSYAHQLGAQLATQEYIAFVDADIVLPEATLSIMLEEIRRFGYANLQARWKAVHPENYWERAQDWHNIAIQRRKQGGLSAAILRRDLVLSVGFDTCEAPAGDDYDFLMKLKKRGYAVGNSRAFVYHHDRTSLLEIVKQNRRNGTSSRVLMRKRGTLHAGFWPPLVLLYWTTKSLASGKPWLIPYFVVVASSQTLGMLRGVYGGAKPRQQLRSP